MTDEDVIVCRCEEITRGEIREAIRQGARTVTGVKRRTRAGMGLCQGRSCEQAISLMIRDMVGVSASEIMPATARPPAVPVPFGTMAGLGGEEP